MNKPKIAIMVSGQLRDYNENHEQWLADVQELFQDFDFDLYGHTWEDQDDPVNMEIFKGFKKTDQDIIWNTLIKDDIFQKIPVESEWFDMLEYQDALDVHSNTDLRQWIKSLITPTYSQLFGHKLCSELCRNNDYAFFVRYRWDCGIDDNRSYLMDYWRKNLLEFAHWQGEFGAGYQPEYNSVCVFTPSVMYGRIGKFIPDLCFLYKPGVHQMFKDLDLDWNTKLRKIIEGTGVAITAHELWSHFIITSDYPIIVSGPNCVSFSNNSAKFDKPHKIWNI